MKPAKWVLVFLVVLSIISGYLMSKASLIGRTGMSLFYREYNFLKVWWKGALLVLILLIGLYLIHGFIQKSFIHRKARTVHFIATIFAVTGLYFTYNDFRHTISHHLLGERFHLGVYLFWIGWIVISVLHLLSLKLERREAAENKGQDVAGRPFTQDLGQ